MNRYHFPNLGERYSFAVCFNNEPIEKATVLRAWTPEEAARAFLMGRKARERKRPVRVVHLLWSQRRVYQEQPPAPPTATLVEVDVNDGFDE